MANTPGPWRVGQEGNLRVYGPDGQGEHSGLIAVVHKSRDNAELIAQAPDLQREGEALRARLARRLGAAGGCDECARLAMTRTSGVCARCKEDDALLTRDTGVSHEE